MSSVYFACPFSPQNLLTAALVVLLLQSRPSLQISCDHYHISCSTSQHPGVLYCQKDTIFLAEPASNGDNIKCQVYGSPPYTTLNLAYKDPNGTLTTFDYIDPNIGSVMKDLSISSLEVLLYVKAYPHTFTTSFPSPLTSITLNIAKTTCLDYAAFMWSPFGFNNRIAFQLELTHESNVIPYGFDYNFQYPVECVDPKATGDITVASGECVWRASYSLPGNQTSFTFYLRTEEDFCKAYCPSKTPDEFIVTSNTSARHACTAYSNRARLPGGVIAGIVIAVLVVVGVIVGLLVYLYKTGKLGAKKGRPISREDIWLNVKTESNCELVVT